MVGVIIVEVVVVVIAKATEREKRLGKVRWN